MKKLFEEINNNKGSNKVQNYDQNLLNKYYKIYKKKNIIKVKQLSCKRVVNGLMFYKEHQFFDDYSIFSKIRWKFIFNS